MRRDLYHILGEEETKIKFVLTIALYLWYYFLNR
jgi:hypothetical protein